MKDQTTKQALLKHFALVLKKRAASNDSEGINPSILKHFNRKQLIEIVLSKFNGSIPKEYNLLEMENEELLSLIGDDMFILAYLSHKWCKETEVIPVVEEKPVIGKEEPKTNQRQPKESKPKEKKPK